LSASVDERSALIQAAGSFGTPLSVASADRLLQLIDELLRWNRTYNLTAITRRDEVITHHLLDSLSIQPALHGTTVADVGTGAGFPGLPLAVVEPERRFTLIDSNNKKVRFVSHAAHLLGLSNVAAVHSRSESFKAATPFDTVVARAFAALPELLKLVSPLCGPRTRVLAMKGKQPDDEIAGVPPAWRVLEVRALQVPGLNEERHLVTLQRAEEPSWPPGD
jgi:16S rRNA (guanine527-N7)-methyltransferase